MATEAQKLLRVLMQAPEVQKQFKADITREFEKAGLKLAFEIFTQLEEIVESLPDDERDALMRALARLQLLKR